jgi:hypothetical protein
MPTATAGTVHLIHRGHLIRIGATHVIIRQP